MYLVLEIQKSADGQLAHLVSCHETQQEADSKFYQVLSYAAMSNLAIHSVTILSEEGYTIRNEHYIHEPEAEETPEELLYQDLPLPSGDADTDET